MSSKTEICNLAISNLGSGKEIANVETEKSQEARACNRYFDIALETLLEEYEWTFATRTQALNLIETDPNENWEYSYRWPVDCLKIIKIVNDNRVDNYENLIPFDVVSDDSGKLIHTDKVSANIKYIRKLENYSVLSANFRLALSYLLASYIAPRINENSPLKSKQEMFAQYLLELSRAKTKDMNLIQRERKESDFIRARY